MVNKRSARTRQYSMNSLVGGRRREMHKRMTACIPSRTSALFISAVCFCNTPINAVLRFPDDGYDSRWPLKYEECVDNTSVNMECFSKLRSNMLDDLNCDLTAETRYVPHLLDRMALTVCFYVRKVYTNIWTLAETSFVGGFDGLSSNQVEIRKPSKGVGNNLDVQAELVKSLDDSDSTSDDPWLDNLLFRSDYEHLKIIVSRFVENWDDFMTTVTRLTAVEIVENPILENPNDGSTTKRVIRFEQLVADDGSTTKRANEQLIVDWEEFPPNFANTTTSIARRHVDSLAVQTDSLWNGWLGHILPILSITEGSSSFQDSPSLRRSLKIGQEATAEALLFQTFLVLHKILKTVHHYGYLLIENLSMAVLVNFHIAQLENGDDEMARTLKLLHDEEQWQIQKTHGMTNHFINGNSNPRFIFHDDIGGLKRWDVLRYLLEKILYVRNAIRMEREQATMIATTVDTTEQDTEKLKILKNIQENELLTTSREPPEGGLKMVEIGVESGNTTERLLDFYPPEILGLHVGIDPYPNKRIKKDSSSSEGKMKIDLSLPAIGDQVYNQVLEKMKRFGTRSQIIRGASIDVANDYDAIITSGQFNNPMTPDPFEIAGLDINSMELASVKMKSDVIPKSTTPIIRKSTENNTDNTDYYSKFDLIYLDGLHDNNSLITDILSWLPRLKPYRILCGHDFQFQYPGLAVVITAVGQKIKRPIHLGPDGMWWVEFF